MTSIFLCHASEDKPLVEPIQLALASAGHDVFYDKQSLPPGGDFQARILAAINRCDIFIFIASPASTSEGKFTLTELKFARERWPSPVKRVLPVAIGGVSPRDLPNYLQAATVMTVSGNAAAEVRVAVDAMLNDLKRNDKRRTPFFVAISVIVIALSVTAYVHWQSITPTALHPSYRTNTTEERLITLNKIQVALDDAKVISDELNENYLESGWGILESYVTKVRRDGEAPHAIMFQRIKRLVQIDEHIVWLLDAYQPFALTEEFKTQSKEFRDHAQRYIDRWNAVPAVISTRNQLPVAKVFPKHFPLALKLEIKARESN